MATADKLQKLIDGKQYVIDKTNAKAGTDLKINSTWQSIGDIIEELETTPSLQEKTTTPNKTPQTIIPDEGYDGLSKVFVNPIPDNYIEPNGTINITSNGTHDVFGYKNANVNVPSEASRIVTPGDWQGTVVPNTGYVENVYFNINLSVEEVVGLLSQLNYTSSSFIDIPIYGLLYKHTWINNEWVDLILSVFKFDDLNYAIVDFDNQLFYFATENVPDMPLDFVGWNPSFNGEIIVNGDVSGSLQDIHFGTQNNLLTNLFSTTPFTQVEGEVITLSGDYDGSSVKITDLSAKQGGWNGTQVPNNDYIEKVYFNTNMSVEETVNILKQLTYKDGWVYYLFANDSTPQTSLQIQYLDKAAISDMGIEVEEEEVFIITSYDKVNGDLCLFMNIEPSSLGMDGVKGWNIESGYVEFNITPNYIYDNTSDQNDKLTSLFSTTPFTKTEPREENVIDVKSYIDKGKLPLKFNIDVPQMLGIQLTPKGVDGVGFTYKFDGIYTSGYAAATDSQYTYNEELTKMVKEFSSYLDVDLENQKIMNSSFYRYKEYDISQELEFSQDGCIKGEYTTNNTVLLHYRTLYMPIELCKIIQSGKYPCVRAKFTLITKPLNNTNCYYVRPVNRLIDSFLTYPIGNYVSMEVHVSGVTAANDAFYTQILFKD